MKHIHRILPALAVSIAGFGFAAYSSAATLVPSDRRVVLDYNWEFIKHDMGSIWEVMRPVPGAGKPEAVPLWENVTLPHCFNAEDCVDPDRNYYQGPAWYRTEINPDSPFNNGRILLEFEGAGQKTDVYIYTTKVASHTGGYDGWTADITDAVRDFSATPLCRDRFKGKIPLAIRCDNSRDTEMIPSDMSDFNLYGGLYRKVSLVYVPETYIESIGINTSVDEKGKEGRAEISIFLTGRQDGLKNCNLTAEIIDPDGKKTDLKTESFLSGLRHTVKKPALWSPSSPALYTLRVTLVNDGDTVTSEKKFGFRNARFEENGPFYLNGKRVLLRGTHRHEDHAGVAAAMTDAMILRDMQQIKDMGANFIRLGHYQQSNRVLELCDSLGIMAWEEIPWCRGGLGGEKYREQGRRMLRNMIAQHGSHPSVIMWGMGNENDWPGDFETFDRDSIRAFFTELVDLSHSLDPSRPTAIRRCDFAKDIVDVYSPTIWAGWYGGRFRDYESMERRGFESTLRFIHAEWGGDSHAGRHAEESFDADGKSSFDIQAGDRNGDWSESYIVRLFDWHLKEQENMPWLTGAAFWTFKDFSTPLRPRNPIPYVNQKGVVQRDNTPKESYYVFQSYWTEKPMVHIYGHSWETRWGEPGEEKEVLVYSNCPEAELFVNGRSLGKKKRDSRDFPAAGLRWKVAYEPGENTIEAVAYAKGETVRDTIVQRYQTEKWGRPAALRISESSENGMTLITATLVDAAGIPCLDSFDFIRFGCTSPDALVRNMGTAHGSGLVQAANGSASILVRPGFCGHAVSAEAPDLKLAPATIMLK